MHSTSSSPKMSIFVLVLFVNLSKSAVLDQVKRPFVPTSAVSCQVLSTMSCLSPCLHDQWLRPPHTRLISQKSNRDSGNIPCEKHLLSNGHWIIVQQLCSSICRRVESRITRCPKPYFRRVQCKSLKGMAAAKSRAIGCLLASQSFHSISPRTSILISGWSRERREERRGRRRHFPHRKRTFDSL